MNLIGFKAIFILRVLLIVILMFEFDEYLSAVIRKAFIGFWSLNSCKVPTQNFYDKTLFYDLTEESQPKKKKHKSSKPRSAQVHISTQVFRSNWYMFQLCATVPRESRLWGHVNWLFRSQLYLHAVGFIRFSNWYSKGIGWFILWGLMLKSEVH